MGLVIDSSVIISAEKGKIDFTKWQNYEQAYIAAITVSELLVGIARADTEERRIKRSAFVEHIISSIAILPFAAEEARIYSQILHNLFIEKLTIGVHDMMIGAIAIAAGYPVLTMNGKDFKRIKGLEVIVVGEDSTTLKKE